MNDVLFESLDYGSYALSYEHSYEFSENVKYPTAEFNKLYVRKIRLPEGRNNIIYILSDSFDSGLRVINSGNFLIPPVYKKVYFPQWSMGMFMNKRYKLMLGKNVAEYKKRINDETKFMAYPTRKIADTKDNVFFLTGDLYQVTKPIVEKMTPKRCYTQYYSDFVSIINSLSPEKSNSGKGPAWDNRIMIIDTETFAFKTGAPLKDNKTNPLYLLYLAYFRTKTLATLDVDMDMMICAKNLFIKFNPAKTGPKEWLKFKRSLFRIIDANLDDYTDALTDEEKSQLEETSKDITVSNIVANATSPYTQNLSGSIKATVEDAVENKLRKTAAEKALLNSEMKSVSNVTNKTIRPTSVLHSKIGTLNKKEEDLFKRIGGYQYQSLVASEEDIDEDYDVPPEDYNEDEEENIAEDATEILNKDTEVAEEILDEIQEKNVPLNTKHAPLNSKRDAKLREEQKKVVVKNETIEQILTRDAANVPIETTDKSKVMHTANENMKSIKFANFDKTYIDELYTKDLVACFDSLKDKDSPFYITNIEIRDTSTTLDYKETWTVKMRDELNKQYTIKVDIPKFQNDRFMLINGTRFIILKQNFYNPLVKDTANTVILTTNYNKITITRKATKSTNGIEKIFSLIKKTGDTKTFVGGDASKGNMRYISTLEYDELSHRLYKFETSTCKICFSRDECNKLFEKPKDIKGNEFIIGMEGSSPILINEDTGLDRRDRTIIEIMYENINDSYKKIFDSIKGPSQPMYVEGKMAGEFIPIIVTLIVWNGLKNTLNRMKIRWKFNSNIRRVPNETSSTKYIRFADGVLEYQAGMFSELMLNGIHKLHPEKLKFEDMETAKCYEDFIYAQWGSYNGINELNAFKEFLVDPITKQVCDDFSLPNDATGLLIHAVKLLCDNAYVSKANDNSYRVRSIEMIPGILYGLLAAQYKTHVKSGKRIPFTLNQRAVITKLLAEKTVEPYSTLNPVVEVTKTHTISTKGYKGSNSDRSYDKEKRSYDPTAVGKLAISTSPDANVGVTKNIVVEPTITNARGYRAPVENTEDLKDVNVFSPTEMLTPGTARRDDPIRTAIAGKQSGHVVPVDDAVPSMVSNGYDEAVQFHLSDDFVINAEEDGQVVDVNTELGFIIVQYKSGKTRAINTNPEIVKNSGAGFYLSNQLVPTHNKVGEKFKKDEPLAYHPKYFYYSKMNGLRFSVGPLTKMAIMSTYNTYEDAGICTERFSERMKTSITYQEVGKFKKNNNILSIVKIGDHVNIGDTLIKFDQSSDDNELAKYLSKLNDDNARLLEEESKNDIKTMHAGKVIDIKVYTLLDPSNLSPSLGKIVQQYFDKSNSKKKFLEKYDSSEGIMKAGYMLTDSIEPIKNRYNTIKGYKGIDVLIEIYIEHSDTMGVGDKIALYGPNKQIVSEIVPKGYEPYSEFRPDEPIEALCSPGTVARRMVTSSLVIMAANKCMKELKEKIRDEVKFK